MVFNYFIVRTSLPIIIGGLIYNRNKIDGGADLFPPINSIATCNFWVYNTLDIFLNSVILMSNDKEN